MARDEDVIGARLRDARRDSAYARLRYELHADARAGVDGLQVVYQLRQVLDRVDVVMGWWGDELHPRLRVAEPGDEVGDLHTGKLSALAGFRALRDLDLELVGSLEIRRSDAEARRGDLLDLVVLASSAIAVQVRVLAAFARVGASADRVHRDGQCLMRLG